MELKLENFLLNFCSIKFFKKKFAKRYNKVAPTVRLKTAIKEPTQVPNIKPEVTDGFAYVQYMIPGLIMMSVITNSYANVVSSFYSVKFQKSIEELLISPMPNWTILLGFIIGGVCRGVLVGVIVFCVSLFFYPDFEIANPLLTITVLLLTSILFSLMGFINAVYADSFDDISVIPTFVLTPLIYLGGVFYSINMLPDFWRSVSQANPMLYVVNTFREGMLGTSDVSITFSLSMIVLFIVSFSALSLYLLKRGTGIRE